DSHLNDNEWTDIVKSYCKLAKPAHVQLAARLGERGFPVQAGTRLEFVVLDHPNKDAKMYELLEDPTYYRRYKDILKINYLYYLKLLTKPLDQLLCIVFKKESVVAEMYKRRLKTNVDRVRENADRVFFVGYDDIVVKRVVTKQSKKKVKNVPS
ncbi:MAG: hypothetical protein EBV19_11065, partial [Flavobacteriia bacterium]|nr:hypothetical protein [Flavobacteriia bacterium]